MDLSANTLYEKFVFVLDSFWYIDLCFSQLNFYLNILKYPKFYFIFSSCIDKNLLKKCEIVQSELEPWNQWNIYNRAFGPDFSQKDHRRCLIGLKEAVVQWCSIKKVFLKISI